MAPDGTWPEPNLKFLDEFDLRGLDTTKRAALDDTSLTEGIVKQLQDSALDARLTEEDAEPVDEDINDPKVKHRVVSSVWPRPSPHPDSDSLDFHAPDDRLYKVKDIPPSERLAGKMTPNKYRRWGATPLDFYHVAQVSKVPDSKVILSGSQLRQWCMENGEGEGMVWDGTEVPAKALIERVGREPEPEVVQVYDVALEIKEREAAIQKAHVLANEEKSPPIKDADTDEWPPTSIFDPMAFPPAWRNLEPFSTDGPGSFDDIPTLECYIPQHLLPHRLIVHDPYKTLHAVWRSQGKGWSDNPECTHTYRLKSPSSTDEERREVKDRLEMEEAEKRRQEILDDFLKNPHSSNKPKPAGLVIFPTPDDHEAMPPPLYITLPPKLQPQAASEAHLYLSPSEYIGSGNHSHIYHAEWELPRSLLVPEELCWQCLLEDACAIIKELDGEEKKFMYETRKVTGAARIFFHHGGDSKKGSSKIFRKNDDQDDPEGLHELPQASNDTAFPSLSTYSGPYRVVQSRCQYQNLERNRYCKHLKDLVHPLTTKVRVATKLSMERDTHLKNEAKNYQAFPKHFFQHWSGFNIVKPLQDPTPVGPVVPQFYGYYVPEEVEEQTEKEKAGSNGGSSGTPRKQYLSPIILMEHCGSPIVPYNLSVDDKQECISLALRFNHEDWAHNSLYQRNILRKPGPLCLSPSIRQENAMKRNGYGVDWSYRLIDFGRSEDSGAPRFTSSLDYESYKIQTWYDGRRGLGD